MGHTPGPKAEAHGCWHTWYTRPATCCDLWEVYVALLGGAERARLAEQYVETIRGIKDERVALCEKLDAEVERLRGEMRVAHNAVAYWAKHVNNATAAKNLGLVVECLRAALAFREGAP